MQPCTIVNPYKSLEIWNQYAKEEDNKLLDAHLKDGRAKIENGYIFCISESKNKLIWIQRKIDKVQSNAIRFEGGSWLYFPLASESQEIENGFIVWDTYEGVAINQLQYTFN